MNQVKIISLPTNQSKIYRQILAVLNFMIGLSPQERDVLAELIRLDNEYEALPSDKRGKFILSTDMRKEIRDLLSIEEKQFNVIISKLRSKLFYNKPLIGDNNIIHPDLKFKPDNEGFKIEINFVNTINQNSQQSNSSTSTEQSTTNSSQENIIEEDLQFELTPPSYDQE